MFGYSFFVEWNIEIIVFEIFIINILYETIHTLNHNIQMLNIILDNSHIGILFPCNNISKCCYEHRKSDVPSEITISEKP